MTASASALAGVDTNGLFELDHNAIDDSVVTGDDWSTPPTSGGAYVFTGIVTDAAPLSIFDGGKKDIQLISNWSHKDGSVPDKDDITNAYAAAYEKDGDLIVYFGADRVANNGSAYLGFWFFKASVKAMADGTFDGAHTAGDTLVLVNFPQGSKESPYIAVVTWDPECTRAASNDPSPGDCAAQNLRLRAEGSSGSGSTVCDAAHNTCAVTNDTDEQSPWSYYAKVPSACAEGTWCFPYETFFEGGINLSEVVGGDTCFSSFMAETRSSAEFSASLKDFVIHEFELCSVDITKTCKKSDLNASQTKFVFTYDVTIKNDGFGGLYKVKVMDDNGTQDVTTDDFQITSFPLTLAKGADATVEVSIESDLNPPVNWVTVTAAGSPTGAETVSDTASAECPEFDRDPRIGVTKACETELKVIDDMVVVGVTFAGQVCNQTGGTSGYPPLKLTNVTVTDDHAGLVKSISLLDPGQCVSYTGSYLPNGTSSFVPEAAAFQDTVTAEGYAPLNLGSVSEIATATCPICECDDMSCEEPAP